MTEHLNTVLDYCARSIYGLRLLRARGTSDDWLQDVFHFTVLARLVRAAQPGRVSAPQATSSNSIDFTTGANVANTAV